MTTPKTKRLLLAAVATIGGSASAATIGCSSSSSEPAGFYGDIAYDGGYDAPADAPSDASDASDAGQGGD